jgi:hypothetical protein
MDYRSMPRSLAQVMTISSFAAISLFGLPTAGMAAQKKVDAMKNTYPEEIVTGYVEACSTAGVGKIPANVMKDICSCTIVGFQNTFTLKEFQKIGEALDQGNRKDVPPEMTKITEDCVKVVLTKPN